MANQPKSADARRKESVWKPFFIMLKSVRLPWLWLIAVLLLDLFGAYLTLLFPDTTASIFAGDIRIATIMRMVIILFLQALLSGLISLVSTVTSSKIDLSFQKLMLKKVMRLPIPFYDKNMADRLISRTTQDTTNISQFLISYILYIPSAIYSLIGVYNILMGYDWHLVMLLGLMIPTMLLLSYINGKLNFKWNDRLQTRLAELSGSLAESLQNIPLMKVFAQEKRETAKGHAAIEELFKTKKKFTAVFNGMSIVGSANSQLGTLISIVGGVLLIHKGYITIDVWIAFYMYQMTALAAIKFFPSLWEAAKTAQGASHRVSEVVAEPSEARGGSLNLSNAQGDFAFENVSFSYEEGHEILRDLSFTIPQGKTTAIIGRSGEGKSTIFGLMERFYQPTAGKITVAGQDISQYDLSQWRRSIGYVSQNNALLSGTVRDNILYGIERPVSEEEIIQAAKDANAYEFIQELENGFDTQVGISGSKLSGGQRQRICIARELLKNPQLLLLDEATSSLDMEAEYQVTQAIERLRKGRTILVVSHRLSAVLDADQIVYLDNHSVSAVGTHGELMKNNSSYASLVNAHTGAAS